MKNNIKNNIKKILVVVLSIVIVMTTIILIINHFNNDGMMQTKGVNIYYRTYTDEDGWSKWSKNGMTSGDKIHVIKNVEMKLKTKDKGEVVYLVYSNGKWSKLLSIDIKNKNKVINGIEIMGTDKIHKKYNIYYRTYNKKDKWFEWSFNGGINGNKEENITALEVKILPKSVAIEDYLKDYSKKEIQSKNFSE